LIRRQLGNSFGDFFDFHGAQLTSSSPPRSNRWGFFQCLRFAQFELRVKAAADAARASPSALNRCPLLGVKGTLPEPTPMSAFDPKRTLATR
jgi:hypothetical protein